MDMGKAISIRICELCCEQHISFYALAIRTDIPPSILNSIL